MGLTRLRAEQISDIDYKQAVRVITVANVTLSGGAPTPVDGVNLSAGDRVLVTGQSTGSQNGIYQVETVGSGSNGTWIRSVDTNATGELEAGTIVMVTEGTVYADSQWKLITDNPIVIGTTALTFEQNSAFAFGNILANSTAVLATTVGSTVTFSPGSGIQITGNNTTKTVTIEATGTATVDSISNGTSNVNVVSSGGNVTVGVNGTNNVTVFGQNSTTFAANVLPAANITYNLGSETQRWNDIWLSNSTIYLGNAQISANATAVSITNPAGGTTVLSGTTPAVSADAVTATGNIQGGNIFTTGLISATGAITGAAITGISLTVSTGNITGGNLLLSGAIIDSAQLDIQTSAANANIALAPNGTGIVTVSTQVSAVGNITGGNLLINGNAQITGNLSVLGTEIIFNVANLTVNDKDIIVANNVTGGANVDGSGIQAGNPATATWFFNNATTSWQSNIGITPTTNGTLALGGTSNYWGTAFITTASVTGNITGGNILTAGLISATGNISGSFFIGNGSQLTGIDATAIQNGTANVRTFNNGNVTTSAGGTANVVVVTSTGTIITGTESVTGNIQGGNLRTAGLVSASGAITAGGDLSLVGNIVDTGPMTVITSSNGNITLAPNGTGVVVVNTDIRNGQANGVGNIGSSDTRFNQVFALATSAQYADLAEKYTADADYVPGTVLEFGGDQEVTATTTSHSPRVAGIVSTLPSYIMNDGLVGDHTAMVSLTGRVPCLVQGPIAKGDRLVASDVVGHAQRLDPAQYEPGCIIGKALEDSPSPAIGTIEVAVGRF